MFFLQRKKLFNSKINRKRVNITFKLSYYSNKGDTRAGLISSDPMEFFSTDNGLNDTQQPHKDADGTVLGWEKQPLQWQLNLEDIIDVYSNKYNFETSSEMWIPMVITDDTLTYQIKFKENLYGYISAFDISNGADNDFIKIFLSTSPDGIHPTEVHKDAHEGASISYQDTYCWYSIDGYNIKTQRTTYKIGGSYRDCYYVRLRVDKQNWLSLSTYYGTKIAENWYEYYASEEDPDLLKITLYCS